jgi:alcohol dehydrogenase
MDALTHAVEAYVGRASNPVSDALAEETVRLLVRFLPRGATDPAGDDEAREALARASTLAGIAFGNADVAGVHCLSESIGGMFDVPHGLANAILLGPVLRYQQDAAGPRLASLARACGIGDAAGAMLDAIDGLACDVGIPPFASLGVPSAAHPTIAAEAERNNSNGSNPMPMSAADYLRVLEAAAK